MYGIIFKFLRVKILLVLLVLSTITSFAQKTDTLRHLKLILGGGYGHYYNTFTNVLDQDVINNEPTFSARLMWQPEYRLRIGLESGYYFIYSTTRIQTEGGSETLTTNLRVVPLFMSFSMRIVNRLELNFGSGWASMIYRININKSKKNKVVGHTYSMSNFSAGCSYYIPLGKKFDLGAELKYLYLGKTDDHHASAFLNLSWKFLTWKAK